MKFRIEKYTIQVRRRGWGACQENDQSDSAYKSFPEDRWKILLDDSVILEDIKYEELAKNYVKIWNNINVEGRLRGIEKLQEGLLKALAKKFKQENAAWVKLQKQRRKILLAKVPMPEKLTNLTNELKTSNAVEELVWNFKKEGEPQ